MLRHAPTMGAQVAADALSATEAELCSKLTAGEREAAEKQATLARLKRRYDVVAAELAGAEANLTSAQGLLSRARAQLALKESLLFEKETLIAALRRRTSAAAGAAASPGFWRSLGRFRRNSSSSSAPASAQEAPAPADSA